MQEFKWEGEIIKKAQVDVTSILMEVVAFLFTEIKFPLLEKHVQKIWLHLHGKIFFFNNQIQNTCSLVMITLDIWRT